MAQYIYDENGKLIGTKKSEEEKRQDENDSTITSIVCVILIILGILSFLLAKPWFDVKDMIENFDVSEFWLEFQYILAIVAIVYGTKTVKENKLTLWRAFWKTVIVLTIVGIAGSVAIPLIFGGFIISFEDFAFSLWSSLLPAVIVVACLLLKRRKQKSPGN